MTEEERINQHFELCMQVLRRAVKDESLQRKQDGVMLDWRHMEKKEKDI